MRKNGFCWLNEESKKNAAVQMGNWFDVGLTSKQIALLGHLTYPGALRSVWASWASTGHTVKALLGGLPPSPVCC